MWKRGSHRRMRQGRAGWSNRWRWRCKDRCWRATRPGRFPTRSTPRGSGGITATPSARCRPGSMQARSSSAPGLLTGEDVHGAVRRVAAEQAQRRGGGAVRRRAAWYARRAGAIEQRGQVSREFAAVGAGDHFIAAGSDRDRRSRGGGQTERRAVGLLELDAGLRSGNEGEVPELIGGDRIRDRGGERHLFSAAVQAGQAI